ncbi:hypothetical protein GCM10010872_06740 [Dyella flava]|nr:hypothetical protein GCM10010872_06740 [Dyella flava]
MNQRIHGARRNLMQQWLPEMFRLPIDQGDRNIRLLSLPSTVPVSQARRQLQTTRTAPYYDYSMHNLFKRLQAQRSVYQQPAECGEMMSGL